ncbi:hypothetical protein TKK_0013675 [Trichogramma kaykai]
MLWLRYRSHEERPSYAPFAAHAVFTKRSVQRTSRAVPTSALPPHHTSGIELRIGAHRWCHSSCRQQQQSRFLSGLRNGLGVTV